MHERPLAVITGGSTGIGLAIVHALLTLNYSVINLARRPVPLFDPRVDNFAVDLTEREALAQICGELSECGATAFIHNAGIIRPDYLEDVQIQDLDTLNQLHLGAAIQIGQALIPTMKAARFGRVVLISSRASVGMAMRTSYSATKAGQIAMARSWALELAAHGITVNTIAPGPIESTEMFHDVVPKDSPQAVAMAEKIPVGRLGVPDDVARAVLFFLDPRNSFLTGQNLFVCGGTSIGSI